MTMNWLEALTEIEDLEDAFLRARSSDNTYVISLVTDPYSWTEGGSFWEVGVPEVSELASVEAARDDMRAGKREQRIG